MSVTDTAPSWTHLRSELANTIRRDPNDPNVPELRRRLRAARLEDQVRRVVDEDPPLTTQERNRIAAAAAPTLADSLPPPDPATARRLVSIVVAGPT